MTLIPQAVGRQLYRTMLRIRCFEETIAACYGEQEMRSPTHLYTGQEAVATGVCAALQPGDKVVGYYRGHGYYLAKGGDAKAMMAELYCKATGANRGKGGSMLLSSPPVNYLGSTALVAGGIPIATGIALASALKQSADISVAFFGDAAVEEGVFFESVNFAALRKLPILFVCENNFYAVQSHISARQAVPDQMCEKVRSFGLPAFKIDGNDVEAVYQQAVQAALRARAGEGPTFIEAVTYRWREHVGPGDDTESGWRPRQELTEWKQRDPLTLWEHKLREDGLLDEVTKARYHLETKREVEEAFAFAKASPLPAPGELLTAVYGSTKG